MGMDKLGNLAPSLLLRSPLHRLVSDKAMLLTFTGRRTGRTYTTPVVYAHRGDEVVITTDSRWWKNLRGGALVTMRLGGKRVTGVAAAVTDPDAGGQILDTLIAQRPSYVRLARIPRRPDGTPDVEEALRRGRVAIRIRLTGEPAVPSPHPVVERYRSAMESGDSEGVVATLAPEVSIHVAVHDEPLRGLQVARHLFPIVLSTFRDLRFTEVLSSAGRVALVFRARIGERPGEVEGVNLMRVDDHTGHITEVTVMVRPLVELQALAEAVGPKMAEAMA